MCLKDPETICPTPVHGKFVFHETGLCCQKKLGAPALQAKHFLLHVPTERVTGRKARGLQMEEIACKCQTFLSLLSGRRKQTSDIFSLSIQI